MERLVVAVEPLLLMFVVCALRDSAEILVDVILVIIVSSSILFRLE